MMPHLDNKVRLSGRYAKSLGLTETGYCYKCSAPDCNCNEKLIYKNETEQSYFVALGRRECAKMTEGEVQRFFSKMGVM